VRLIAEVLAAAAEARRRSAFKFEKISMMAF
jgi:hypothetical protein